jgi:hypothetical protein
VVADRSPERIRAATMAVLDDAAYRQAALRVASEALRRPGLDHALDLVETVALERVPIPTDGCERCSPGTSDVLAGRDLRRDRTALA